MTAKEINPGDEAPVFEADSSEGAKVSLKKLRGKTVVLYFYPKDSTSGCTKEACSFRDNLGTLSKRGAVVLGVSRDSLESHGNFIGKYDLNFPLLSDPEGKMHDDYGVWKFKTVKGEKKKGVNRSTFLIDGTGVVREIWRNVKVDGHTQQVLEAIESLG